MCTKVTSQKSCQRRGSPKAAKIKSQKYSKGQSVLEFLVALSLIIFFLLGVVVLEIYSIRNTKYAQDKSTATKLANQQIERARVIRDSVGIDALLLHCSLSSCYINDQLTPLPITPTGIYGQSLKIETATNYECLVLEATLTPPPVSYKVKGYVSWSQGVQVTPPKEVGILSCITDWR